MSAKFPILSIEDNWITSKIGDLSIGLKVRFPEEFSCSSSQLEELHNLWIKIVKALPVNTIIHKQDIFIYSPHDTTDRDSDSFFEKANKTKFYGRSILDHSSYLFFTLSSRESMRRSSKFSSICSGSIIPQELSKKNIEDFTNAIEVIKNFLRSNGIAFEELTTDEYLGTDKESGIYDRYMSLCFNSQPQVVDFHFKDDFKVGDQYVGIVGLTDLYSLPETISHRRKNQEFSNSGYDFFVDYLYPISFGIKFSHIVNQYIFIEDQKKIQKSLEQNLKTLRFFSRMSAKNPIGALAAEEFINSMTVEEKIAVKSAINITYFDASKKNLVAKENYIKAALQSMNCTPKIHTLNAPQIFWGGIPGAASEYPFEETFLTTSDIAANLFISTGDSISDEIGLTVTDRISGKPLKLNLNNRKKQDNLNKIIIGPSGSGKSFFVNHYLRSTYDDGNHIVIIDTGYSYYPLCSTIAEITKGKDGKYFTVTEENPLSFNPFWDEKYDYDIEKKETLKDLLVVLWLGDNQPTKPEETQLSNAVNEFINKIQSDRSIYPCFDSFYDFLSTEFKKSIAEKDIMRDNFDIQNMLEVLRPYYKDGAYGYLLNSKDEMNLLENRFIVFELEEIKNDKILFPVAAIMIMEIYKDKIRKIDPTLKKSIFIDEAWQAISKTNTAQFIVYLYKTVRKHNGEVAAITQSLEDFATNEMVMASVITNSDVKILLDHRKHSKKFDYFAKALGLDKHTCTQILSINNNLRNGPKYKEAAFITTGSVSEVKVYGCEVSPFEAACYSSEKVHRANLLDEVKKTGSFLQAIKNLGLKQITK